MADTIKTNLGPVTAYADAKAHGYPGTREEFGQQLAGVGDAANEAVAAKNAALAAATKAEKAAQSAGGSGGRGTALDMPAIISFVDDDCRAESYTLLWPVIQAKKIPYALACPPSHIGENSYLTKEQLTAMVTGGCEVLSHHWRKYAMTQFDTAEAYEEDVQKSLAALADLGVTNVRGVAYPNGYYNDSYMPVVRRYFDMGFTVERGINTPPVESCYMKRCELFPTNGAYTLEDAKQLVDEVATNGGWLIFMTHAWYTTFSAADLTALIDYITAKGVAIVGMGEGMDTIGNVVDIGYAHKPLNEMTTPYYLVDCLGRVYANTWNYTAPGTESRVEVTLPYHTGYTLTTSGTTKANADTKRVITDRISAAAGERYLFCNLSAKYGNCFYVIYDANNAVLEYKGTAAASTGETLPDTEVTMPENTAYFRLACDLGVNTAQFQAYKLTGSSTTTPDSTAQQALETANKALETANSVRSDADAGKFTGPAGAAGAKGDKGDTGAAGPAGAQGETGPAGPGFSDTAKALMIDLFTAAAYGSANMQEKVTALKAEWGQNITVPVSKVALSKETLELAVGSSETLTATVTPSNATDKTVTWGVSPAGFATVTGGKVEAVKAGSCTVTATAGGKSASCAVTVSEAQTIPGETPVYKLAQAKQFLPENKECIDTGIKLFEDVSAQPTWTILLDADDFGRLQSVAETYVMLHCMTEADPWPGLCFQISNGGRFQMNLFGRNQPYGYYAGSTDTHVKTYVQIKGNQFRAGSDPAADNWGTISGYDTNVPQTLLLGCSQDTSGSKDRYWDGTIERFEVYNKELTNDQIAAWLAQ